MAVPISAAMVIPEMGLALTPMTPVIRDETTTKKNPKMMIRTAPSRLTPTWGTRVSTSTSAIEPAIVTQIGRSMSVRSRLPSSPTLPLEVLESRPEGADDGRQRPNERDDARRCYRTGADVEHELGPRISLGLMSRISLVSAKIGSVRPEPNRVMAGIRTR